MSSTLFSAILYTDLDVLERANHSMPVHYVPSGMDATVFWDSPDFKFENNHKYPVKIVMNMDSSDTPVSYTHLDVYKRQHCLSLLPWQ